MLVFGALTLNTNHKTLMKNLLQSFALIFTIFLLSGCAGTQDTSYDDYDYNAYVDDGIIEFTFFHINDVYEISPLEGGKVGGMARVATVFKQLKEENYNTLFVHGGDFVNPSLIGTLKYKDEAGEEHKIKGKQMIEVLNACGLDLVTFGNHEFDISEDELQKRLNESNFTWMGTNLLHKKGERLEPFHQEREYYDAFCPETYTWTITDDDGTSIDIGIFGATINSNQQEWVYYEDHTQEAMKAYLELVPRHDVIFGLTHLEMVQDLKLASMFPKVPLIMGGHDHQHMTDTIGNVIVAKADANAKTAYVHRITYNKNTNDTYVNSELLYINDQIEDDPYVAEIVEKWNKIQDENLTQIIDNPYEVIYTTSVPLDGRESSIRNFQTNLGEMIAAGFAASAKTKKADAAIMNGGSVRIDDQLMGDVQAVDLFRAMPFGGQVFEIDIKGSQLKKVLNQGLENKGIGGYLQWHNIEYDESSKVWKIGGKSLSNSRTYHIALNDYLTWGSETIAPLLKGITPTKPAEGDEEDPRSDVRKAAIEYMKTL